MAASDWSRVGLAAVVGSERCADQEVGILVEILKTVAEFTLALTLAELLKDGLKVLAGWFWQYISTTVRYWTWRITHARKTV